MVGIVSYGVYVPLWRLDLASVEGGQKGEKAIANFDEDSLTMGVAAAIDCLKGMDRGTIDGVFFASTTSPYREKQASVTIATALDLREDIMTADFANSLRAGTSALRTALGLVRAGMAKTILVVASDVRPTMPGSDFERLFGDGAAALVIGSDSVRVEIKHDHSMSHEIIDTWRSDKDQFVRAWEERFIMEEGYLKVMPAAVSSFLKKACLAPKDFSKVVFNATDSRRHRELAQKLGFDAAQVQNPMFGLMGDTGAAFSLMMLVAALDEAKPGDKLLLVGYGNGVDAFLLESRTKSETTRNIKGYLNSKRILKNYMAYLRWHGIMEAPVRGRSLPEFIPSASALYREQEKNLRFHGVKCKQCGTVQYPPQHVCIKCHAREQFEKHRLWDKKAELFTFSANNGIETPDPPYVLAIVDFEGGGRIWLNMTDKDESQLKVGMPVELTFRKLVTLEGIHNYFWKCMPVRL